MSNCENEITEYEFIGRFLKAIKPLLGLDLDAARSVAEASYEDWDKIDTPEECAASEASYWGD